jgi:hypothetical protein
MNSSQLFLDSNLAQVTVYPVEAPRDFILSISISFHLIYSLISLKQLIYK